MLHVTRKPGRPSRSIFFTLISNRPAEDALVGIRRRPTVPDPRLCDWDSPDPGHDTPPWQMPVADDQLVPLLIHQLGSLGQVHAHDSLNGVAQQLPGPVPQYLRQDIPAGRGADP